MSTAQQVPDILSPEFAANPYPAYRTMRDSAPLIRHEATQSWIVSRYEDVERVFKDRAGQFTTENYDWQIEPVHGRTILQLSGREHAGPARPGRPGLPRGRPPGAVPAGHRAQLP